LVFGWDFRKYIKEGKLILEYSDPFQLTDIITPLIEKIKKNNIKRVAIDSTSIFGLYFKDSFEVRKQLYKLIMALKASGATSLLTAEIPEGSQRLSRFSVEEFIVDGVIVLHYIGIGEGTYRSIQVRKMRRTDHSHEIHSMKITEKGIVVLRG
jgi:circadian clock protein KaiC